MNVTDFQLRFFMCSFLTGAVFGGCYSALKRATGLKNRFLKAIFDVLFFVFTAAAELFVSFYLDFGQLRLYMPLGVLLGVYAAEKSIAKIVAFFEKRVYNKIEEKSKR